MQNLDKLFLNIRRDIIEIHQIYGMKKVA
jgi:hypothetical protein